jgi:hypothetical protein
MQCSPIFDQLELLSEGILQHFTDDLYIHDRRCLHHLEVDATYIWIAHKCGTHLARWDVDCYAGSKQSHLEALIRQACFGMWPGHLAAMFTVTEQDPKHGARGYVSSNISLEGLKDQLPRPKPKTIKPQQEVYSAAFALASL